MEDSFDSTPKPKLAALRDVIGSRGEGIVYHALAEYAAFGAPLFDAAFLGQKWPAVDFYVELMDVVDLRPFFLIQAKSTGQALADNADALTISATANDVVRLRRLPGPTYVFGVHEPSRRVFAKAVHGGTPAEPIIRVEVAYELTPANLRRLYDEVVSYWRGTTIKPSSSVFS